jgi:glycosyltransferase involved in cell wall biosynthesis
MRVLFAASEVGFGGGERLFIDLVRSAINLDLNVSITVREQSELWKMLNMEGANIVAQEEISHSKYDILIANDAHSLRANRSHANLSHFICHGPWEATFIKLAFCLMFRVKVSVVSNHVASSFPYLFRSMIRPTVLMYGPSQDFISEYSVTKQAAREMLEIPEQAFVIANVSRFHPVKRLPMLLETIDMLGSEVYGAIAVSKNFHSSEEKQAYSEFHDVRSGSTNVRIVEDSDVRLVLSAADVYVSTSQNETLGISMLEALSFGLPLISTATDGPSDFIRPGLNGWTIESSSKSISTLLLKVLNDKKMLKEMKTLAEFMALGRSPERALQQILRKT